MKQADLPVCGPNGDPIPHTDLRLNELVFVADASGDGWSVARLLPEMKATITEEDGSTEETTETPSSVFTRVMIPTTFWEPHPRWAEGREPSEGLSADDLAQQEQGFWSQQDYYSWQIGRASCRERV